MNSVVLLEDLRARGVLLEGDSDRLLVDAPAGAVTEDLVSLLAEHKAKILELLAWERERERRLLAAGWSPKRGCGPLGLTIWADPASGFYCSQEVALLRLERGIGGRGEGGVM